MKRVEVLIPFRMAATNTNHVVGDVIEVSEEQLAKIRAIHVNMVAVLGDAEEQAAPKQAEEKKPAKSKSKK